MNLSIVIPLLNEQESLPELHNWIVKVMQAHNYSYEILFINDGSTNAYWNVIEKLLVSAIFFRSSLVTFVKFFMAF